MTIYIYIYNYNKIKVKKGVKIENKKYLTEEKYQKVNKVFKTFYFILAIIGIGIIVAEMVMLLKNKPTNYLSIDDYHYGAIILIIIGFVLTAFSIRDLFRHAFTRDITAYYAQQQMPIAKEVVEETAPTIGKAAKEISKGIKEGLKDEEK